MRQFIGMHRRTDDDAQRPRAGARGARRPGGRRATRGGRDGDARRRGARPVRHSGAEGPDALRGGARRRGARPAATTPRCSSTPPASPPSTCRGSRRRRGRCGRCPADSRSGSHSSCCCAAPTRCCCSTSRTTSSTYRPSVGLRPGCASRTSRCSTSPTTVSCWPRRPTRVVTVEGGSAWTHPGGFASWHEAREARYERLDELRRRWDEEHQKLKDLVADVQAEGGVQRRTWPRATRRRRPGCASSRRPARRSCDPRIRTSACAWPAGGPASAR